ncbi:unnamed protein product [Lupinus luteus]|uniref:Calcineurin-like phosphoesterase domain-containing protein n=1 Tax=Lupinus luteus TaxID=3873 RepID=A0AAV1Y816_LUPLU
MGSVNGHGKQPLFSFGMISDVQYADILDGRSFLGVPRYYRHSILVLQRAVKEWNNHQKHKFVINFGDIVDGYCPKDESLNTVKKIVNEFEMFNGHVHHLIGNHCLYNLPRSELLPLFKIKSLQGHAYYDFSPVPEYRFVVLDGYDNSAIGWPRDHPRTLEALKFLREKNPNEDKNNPTGLVGLERRYLMFNGGASSKEALLWNYEEVMNLIHKFNCVKVCISGHDHKGGYYIDSHGVHHRVLEAALECPPGTNAFGYADVYDDRISLYGTDRMRSTHMYFDPNADF